MLTTEAIRAAINGTCCNPIKSTGGYHVTEAKAIAYAAQQLNGKSRKVNWARCKYESGPNGWNDRRIKAVAFYTDAPFNSWTPYGSTERPKKPPTVVIEIPHWNAAQARCDWGWYKKHRTAEDRRLGGKCHFTRPMPGKE